MAARNGSTYCARSGWRPVARQADIEVYTFETIAEASGLDLVPFDDEAEC